MKTLAESIPVRFRRGLYSVLGTAVAIEGVFDFIEGELESKLLALLIVLGFGVALGNTGTPVYTPKEEV